jgi:hypothetical protein
VWACFMFATWTNCLASERERERGRKREGGGRERERGDRRERKREKEIDRERENLFIKRMTDALATFSYLVIL